MTSSFSQGTPAIELRNVSCRFISPDGKATVALRDFSMSVARGEFVAIVGPTGCGKSTTLSMITGLLKPTTGEVRVMGAPVNGIDPRIGFVFQADAVFPWRSVLDNVAAGPLFRGRSKSAAYDEANEWLRRVGLANFGKHYPHQLSGGMRKRVALAQTFINKPEILLMDEPFSALDAQNKLLLQEELLRIWEVQKKTVIFITHSVVEAVFLGDRIMVMTAQPGRVKSFVRVQLPRPRNIIELQGTPEFGDIVHRIWAGLREEVQRAREQEATEVAHDARGSSS